MTALAPGIAQYAVRPVRGRCTMDYMRMRHAVRGVRMVYMYGRADSTSEGVTDRDTNPG